MFVIFDTVPTVLARRMKNEVDWSSTVVWHHGTGWLGRGSMESSWYSQHGTCHVWLFISCNVGTASTSTWCACWERNVID
jgi:hypothetical protein